MAVPIWPSNVPHECDADGATPSGSFTPPLVSETDGGPAIMRRRPGPRSTSFPWRSSPLDDAQWSALDDFLGATLIDATLVFDMPVWKPGAGYVTRKCQIQRGTVSNDFSEPPWSRVSFTLIVYNW